MYGRNIIINIGNKSINNKYIINYSTFLELKELALF